MNKETIQYGAWDYGTMNLRDILNDMLAKLPEDVLVCEVDTIKIFYVKEGLNPGYEELGPRTAWKVSVITGKDSE